jgi:hypothetical protein
VRTEEIFLTSQDALAGVLSKLRTAGADRVLLVTQSGLRLSEVDLRSFVEKLLRWDERGTAYLIFITHVGCTRGARPSFPMVGRASTLADGTRPHHPEKAAGWDCPA